MFHKRFLLYSVFSFHLFLYTISNFIAPDMVCNLLRCFSNHPPAHPVHHRRHPRSRCLWHNGHRRNPRPYRRHRIRRRRNPLCFFCSCWFHKNFSACCRKKSFWMLQSCCRKYCCFYSWMIRMSCFPMTFRRTRTNCCPNSPTSKNLYKIFGTVCGDNSNCSPVPACCCTRSRYISVLLRR